MEQPTSPTCLFCGERIAPYEPIRVLEHDGDRETSFAREPGLEKPETLCVHSACVHHPPSR